MATRPGDEVEIQRTTRLVGGGIASASSITGTLVRNGDDTAETVTITNLATGRYKIAFTIPSGWSRGDEVEVRLAATVGGVSEEAVTWSDTLITGTAAGEASTPGSVSGVTLYAAAADVQFVWSEFGATARLDDDQDGAEDPNLMNLALQKASLDVNRYLIQRYTVAVIAASTWARWATAYFAASIIATRRGNTLPTDLEAEIQRYRDDLQRIRDGKDHLQSDTGLATPRNDSRPAVTNFGVDGRYPSQKIRRKPNISTGPAQNSALERHDEPFPYMG